ncbi:P pilus assembly chaperone PapD [Serratia fonticola]|jgi:chaperone protein PapD|uniref:P pilus assembly chaperone PapD n=1 Tax=Serratia fonticola TaxID=47917 RepID=A0A542BKJ3_SERFO|nr:P pilus assembly chaperone PapD [Serratia fonticola]TQI98878.1 P pilus assembly chaperone PapD [Serratia fonticola]TVZ68403.1 P pilus assembly chaperone PapD [Serratia fonticola]
MRMVNKFQVGVITCLFALASSSAYAAIALDRTRLVYPGSDKSVTLNIQNDSREKPYLAQAWIEDANGNKVASPLSVTPALQRVEAGKKSIIRVNALPASASLPQDRESLFYFIVKEIPPKSERPNVLQFALQTKIKVFYRPAGVIPPKFSRHDDKLVLYKANGGYDIENPTPYFMTVLGISGVEKGKFLKDADPIMIPPKSKGFIKSEGFSAPYVTTINDFGGKPSLKFKCSGSVCHADVKS